MIEPQPVELIDGADGDQWYIAFGARLKAAREARGITQSRLADSLGLQRSSVANIEAGRQRLYLHSIVTIATILGVAVDELLGMATASGVDVVYRAEFRETIRDDDGGISWWRQTADLNDLLTRMATRAEYAPVAEVRTATTFYGKWQRINLTPSDSTSQGTTPTPATA